MKNVYRVRIEVKGNPLITGDTVDAHLSKLAGALDLFADAFHVELEGDAEGSWIGEHQWREVMD